MSANGHLPLPTGWDRVGKGRPGAYLSLGWGVEAQPRRLGILPLGTRRNSHCMPGTYSVGKCGLTSRLPPWNP